MFQPFRIARYSWILTVKSLKFLGVCRDQSFDCLLPFARAWKEFWSTTLRFSQEPQRTFRLVYREVQSWRTRDNSRSSRWNSRGDKQDDRGLFNWKEGRLDLRIKSGFKKGSKFRRDLCFLLKTLFQEAYKKLKLILPCEQRILSGMAVNIYAAATDKLRESLRKY